MSATKLLIDTDPGVDDAMAVLFAAQHPDIDLVGLTTIFGNVTTSIATRNALALVELSGQSVPVAQGAAVPIEQPAQPVADFVHGTHGFGDLPPRAPSDTAISKSAAAFICDTVNAHPGEVVLCPVGPLTNIALALDHDPSIADTVKSVVVMGGSVEAGGNVTDWAEANIWQDPHAANRVFSANWDVTMVGLDVTHEVICTPPEFAALAADAPVLGGFLNDAAQFYFKFHQEHNGFLGCHMHDPTAVIAVIRPDLFETRRTAIDVVETGDRVGQTVAVSDPAASQVNCCVTVDVESVRELFLSTISNSF